MIDSKTEDTICKEQKPLKEYTHFQQFIDNLPYIAMIFLGAVIFIIGFETLFWKWFTAGIYVLYGATGAFWIIVFVCPYCHYFNTKSCPCGYANIASKLRTKKDDSLFTKKFKRHIPVIVPLWIFPTLAGVIFLILGFSFWMLGIVLLFAINSFAILPLISRKYGCAHCPQKDTCVWMKL